MTFSFKAPFWSMGFRPFFLLVIILAIVATIMWVLQITGFTSLDLSPLTADQWHSNEMIFGFLTAAIIGFLLTASANWTGTRGIHGRSLFIIFCLFIFTRIVFWTTPFEGIWVYRFVGVIVPVWPVFHLTKLFIQTNNKRNLIMIIPLSMLVAGQVILLSSEYTLGYELALFSVRFLVVVIAGRVIPFFTKKALGMEEKWNRPVLEKLTILSAFLLIFEPFYRQIYVGSQAWVGLTFLALILNSYRLVNWRFFPSFKVKILFVLYLAYLWLPIHFAFNLASHFDWFTDIGKAGLHSLAYGCMGVMILGIIHRVTLGHTGRFIKAGPLALAAYALIVSGSLLRVFGPLFIPTHYLLWLSFSGILWVVAFLAIGIEMIPMLFSPRVDGKEY
ncbi:MAG: NnrS family protein [Halobacteriovoraceae bacterium]|nr:NnrS family protein [Halobacteriovoraceae bacterium]